MTTPTVQLDNPTLIRWLNNAFQDVAAAYNVPLADFWPGQGQATSITWALFLRSTREVHGDGRPLYFYAPFHGDTHSDQRRSLLNKLWEHHHHVESEVMLDFTAHDPNAPHGERTLLSSAESEMFAAHSVAEWGDYGWDFYKLMLVPSPLRLFLCRVGAVDGGDAEARRDELQDTLERHMLRQAPVRAAGDQIGIILLAAESGSDAWRDTRVWTSGSGRWARAWPTSSR